MIKHTVKMQKTEAAFKQLLATGSSFKAYDKGDYMLVIFDIPKDEVAKSNTILPYTQSSWLMQQLDVGLIHKYLLGKSATISHYSSRVDLDVAEVIAMRSEAS